MKIELKKISFNERLSEETNAFVADLYIDGKKVGECKNSGQGGCTDYYGNSKQDNEVIRKAEAYFKTLPKVKPDGYNFEYQPTLEYAIDDEFENWLKAKEQKKFEKKLNKKMQTAVLFGIPNADSYAFLDFKQPLSKIPTVVLQSHVNKIKAKHCTGGEIILNTNLQGLGISI